MSEGGIFPCTRPNCRQCNPGPNWTKSGLPHGGRIAYPKPYYQIMASKSIPTIMKKNALAQIREWHKEKSPLYNPNASHLTILVAFSKTPQGYHFWSVINNAISKF